MKNKLVQGPAGKIMNLTSFQPERRGIVVV